jgi:hypothetical protein
MQMTPEQKAEFERLYKERRARGAFSDPNRFTVAFADKEDKGALAISYLKMNGEVVQKIIVNGPETNTRAWDALWAQRNSWNHVYYFPTYVGGSNGVELYFYDVYALINSTKAFSGHRGIAPLSEVPKKDWDGMKLAHEVERNIDTDIGSFDPERSTTMERAMLMRKTRNVDFEQPARAATPPIEPETPESPRVPQRVVAVHTAMMESAAASRPPPRVTEFTDLVERTELKVTTGVEAREYTDAVNNLTERIAKGEKATKDDAKTIQAMERKFLALLKEFENAPRSEDGVYIAALRGVGLNIYGRDDIPRLRLDITLGNYQAVLILFVPLTRDDDENLFLHACNQYWLTMIGVSMGITRLPATLELGLPPPPFLTPPARDFLSREENHEFTLCEWIDALLDDDEVEGFSLDPFGGFFTREALRSLVNKAVAESVGVIQSFY